MSAYSIFLRAVLFIQIQFVLALPSLLAQNGPVAVSGKVVDEKNVPLQGVSVQVKGGKVIGITDKNGSFSAAADKKAVLQFTYQGYGVYERAVDNGVFNVSMVAESKSLENVVVIGYGTQKKRAVTGAVA